MNETNIFNIFSTWRDFILHLINHIVSFKNIIVLAKTCKSINHYFRSTFRIYDLLCKYHINKINIIAFNKIDNLNYFDNKQIFLEIFNIYKNFKLWFPNEIMNPPINVKKYLAKVTKQTVMYEQYEKKKEMLENKLKIDFPDLF